MQSIHAKTFTVLLPVAALLALLLPVCLNFSVDPFGIYRVHDAHSLSRIDQLYYMRNVKPQQVRQRQPRTAVVGSSIGGRIITDHPDWQDHASFNLSLPGATPYEMYRMVRHSHAIQPLRELVVALDFSVFSTKSPRVRFGFPEQSLLLDAATKGSWSDRVEVAINLRNNLMTSTSLVKSIEALINGWRQLNTSLTGAIYYGDGSWERHNTEDRPDRFQRAARGFKTEHTLGDRQFLETDRLSELLEFCYGEGIATTLVVNPMHLFQLEFLRQSGAFPTWQRWHRELLQLNRALATAAGREPFPILVFNHASHVVAESVSWPNANLMPWFEDGFHYSAKLGRVILSEALQAPRSREHRISQTLDSLTIEAYLESVKALLDDYARDHRESLDLAGPPHPCNFSDIATLEMPLPRGVVAREKNFLSSQPGSSC